MAGSKRSRAWVRRVVAAVAVAGCVAGSVVQHADTQDVGPGWQWTVRSYR